MVITHRIYYFFYKLVSCMKVLICIVIILFTTVWFAEAQSDKEKDTLNFKVKELDEIIVYANKFPELMDHIAQSVKVLRNEKTLQLQANTGDILINTGTLFVQKSQQGGGSPVIRGFEASRVLLNVDGVRLNNAIYRAGHLQNIITIDNMVLDRIEVLYGPSSTLYGSDALGGVISMYTKNPTLSQTNKTIISGSATIRYATAIQEQRGNITLNIGTKKWASLTSITHGSFGDVIQGKNRRNGYETFGLKTFIVSRIANRDTILNNPNPEKQNPSGYKQFDLMQKILFQPTDNVQHILNIQISGSSDIPRYDRLTDIANGLPAYSEWYYGPAERNMIGYTFSANKLVGFFQQVKSTLSFQDIGESRITRRFQSNNKDYRYERVNVFGVNLDAKHYGDKHELQTGIESYINYVKSTAIRQHIITGNNSKIPTRYADGPVKMSYNALYAQHTLFINERWTMNDGVRLNFTTLDAVFADTSLMHLPFDNARQNHFAVTGNAGIVYANNSQFRMGAVISTGFRSPNIDDLSKVFESKGGTLIVPNQNLKPEYTYNAEINIHKRAKYFSIGGSVFYTWFTNALVLDNFTLNGKDSIVYDGIQSGVFALQNKSRAFITGFSANALVQIFSHTNMDGVITYTYGRFNNEGSLIPLDHVPPVYGRVAINHAHEKWKVELYALFNGWKRLKDYNPDGEDNLQYATSEGMPAWYTLNAIAAVSVASNFYIQLSVENIFDRNYRYFASGISAPGINFTGSLRYNF